MGLTADAALKAWESGQVITGKDDVLGPLVGRLTESALESEPDSRLAGEVIANHKNGKFRKTVKSSNGAFELETPRDRAGSFEPTPSEFRHSKSNRLVIDVDSSFGQEILDLTVAHSKTEVD